MATKVMVVGEAKDNQDHSRPHVQNSHVLNEKYNALNKHDGRGMMFFSVLLRRQGSVVPSVFPIALFSACIAGFLLACDRLALVPPAWLPILRHPIPVQMFAIVLGYVIVLRSNLAVARYFEAISNVQFFGSKWVDAYTQLAGFIRTSNDKHVADGRPERTDNLKLLLSNLTRWFTIMHGLAINSLQITQLDLEESEYFDRISICPLPDIDFNANAIDVHTGQNYRASLSLPGKKSLKRLSVESKQSTRSPSKDISNPKDIQKQGSSQNVEGSNSTVTVPHGSSASDMATVEGATGDTAAGLAPLTVLGGLTEREKEQLHKAEDKIDLLHSWVIEAISQASLQSDILTQAPILSRVYQELSNGMLGYNQAFKIALVQFPFAFAQMLTLFLFAFVFACPVAVYAFTGGELLTPLLTLFTVLGFWGIHEIAVEVENPFGGSANQLPMKPLHDSVCVSIFEACMAIKPDRTRKGPSQIDPDQ